MNKEPTREQVREFWEWCGFTDTFEGDTGAYYWKAPNGNAGVDLPPIDLNNLFLYAVPKVVEIGIKQNIWGTDFHAWVRRGKGELRAATDPDPALALFWALWQVMDSK